MQINIRLMVLIFCCGWGSGCSNEVVAYQVTSPSCPSLKIIAKGRVENYKILIKIEGEDSPIILVENIDLPSDVGQYILNVESVEDGIKISVIESDYVKNIDYYLTKECRIYTTRI